MRRFGVEIEFSWLNGMPTTFFQGYDLPNYSLVEYKLYSIGFDGPYFEAKSSILNNMDQPHEIVQRLKTDNGATICKRHHCGIHVHIEHGLSLDRLTKLRLRSSINQFWRMNYDAVITQFKPVMQRRQYCWDLESLVKHSMIYIHEEYPTIEFRLFNAVLNSRYVCLCVKKAQEWADEILSRVNRNSPCGAG